MTYTETQLIIAVVVAFMVGGWLAAILTTAFAREGGVPTRKPLEPTSVLAGHVRDLTVACNRERVMHHGTLTYLQTAIDALARRPARPSAEEQIFNTPRFITDARAWLRKARLAGPENVLQPDATGQNVYVAPPPEGLS